MKKPRIVIEQNEDGAIRLKVDNVHGEPHAIFLLSKAIQILVTDEVKEEEVTSDDVQELPTTDEDKE